MNVKTLFIAVIGIAALMTTASIRATEIKVLASNGVREALLERAPSGAVVGKLVAGGEVQYGVILVNELMAAPGVEVLGPLPAELQNYTVFHAGVGVGSKDSSAAKALIKFLTTPSAGAVFKAKGQEAG